MIPLCPPCRHHARQYLTMALTCFAAGAFYVGLNVWIVREAKTALAYALGWLGLFSSAWVLHHGFRCLAKRRLIVVLCRQTAP